MSRKRPTWPELPARLREIIEERTGTVTSWTSHDGGYSPGPALTLTTPEGRVFVKAADPVEHPVAGDLHRREAKVARVLPPGVPAPALRWSVDEDWVVLAFDAVDGRPPRVPWVPEEVREVAALVDALAEIDAPESLPDFADSMTFEGWRGLAGGDASGLGTYDPWTQQNLGRLAAIEATWQHAVAGETLVHQDLRGDNVLLTDQGAVVVDWPYAARGAAFSDLVGWLPSLRLEGGPEPEEMLTSTRVGREADPDAVTALIVAMAGFFVSSSLEAPPPGIPHLRAFQRAQGEVCLDWLQARGL